MSNYGAIPKCAAAVAAGTAHCALILIDNVISFQVAKTAKALLCLKVRSPEKICLNRRSNITIQPEGLARPLLETSVSDTSGRVGTLLLKCTQ